MATTLEFHNTTAAKAAQALFTQQFDELKSLREELANVATVTVKVEATLKDNTDIITRLGPEFKLYSAAKIHQLTHPEEAGAEGPSAGPGAGRKA